MHAVKWLLIGLLCTWVPAWAQESVPAWAQEKLPLPPEGATVIAVLLPDSGAVAFERVARLLVQQGYSVETRDPTAQRLTTAPHPLAEAPFSTSVQAIVMGHTVLFSGSVFYKTSRSGRALMYSAYSHVHFANYDYVAAGWRELEAIVQALPGKRKVVHF